MADTDLLKLLQKEVSCSICNEYFSDPVSTDCGHCFCKKCILGWNCHNGNRSCPQCSLSLSLGTLRPVRQLANMAMTAKLLEAKYEAEKQLLCERHKEKLLLFCEHDRKTICVICERSVEHRYHKTVLIKELIKEASEMKELWKALEFLSQEMDWLQRKQEEQESRMRDVKSSVAELKERIGADFRDMHEFLRCEEEDLCARLNEEQNNVLQELQENVQQLSQSYANLKNLKEETEKKFNLEDITFLRTLPDDIKDKLLDAPLDDKNLFDSAADLFKSLQDEGNALQELKHIFVSAVPKFQRSYHSKSAFVCRQSYPLPKENKLVDDTELLQKRIESIYIGEHYSQKLEDVFCAVVAYDVTLQQVKTRKMVKDHKDFATGKITTWLR
ncbi:tripartite motif-containing protein 5-like [Protopterus annectens]|uniref:tripartite motif-containing protein 5-like n=1 Tax=Protopterus annectens TaxID=7888 RepID=UPI001CF9F164|nr:tripartite motif-containing protein 5-like [Protopterus annectens]